MDDSEVLFGPTPSKGTAVTAGLATLTIGLFPTFAFLGNIALTVSDWPVPASSYSLTGDLPLDALLLLLLLLWNSAGLLLLAGRRAGRVMTILCSVIGVLYFGTGLAAFTIQNDIDLPIGIVFGSLLLASSVAGVCAARRDTGYWVDYRTASRIERRSVPGRRAGQRNPIVGSGMDD